MFSCFGCSDGSTRNPLDLSKEKLKRLYDRSIEMNGGKLIVHGVFARANKKNNNRRVYPKSILKREVASYERARILTGTALGELDHPNYNSVYFKSLSLNNVSHQVLEVHWRGDRLFGTIEILQTPSGLLLWELYSQGVRLGVSSRGWASLRSVPKEDAMFVEDDFELITFDFVTEPSTVDAFLAPLQRRYSGGGGGGRIPDQSHIVQIAHLGHGIPDATLSTLAPPPSLVLAPNLISDHLDQLLRHSHYIVYQDASYLVKEDHARDFKQHLAMFATRAHLAHNHKNMSRRQLDELVIKTKNGIVTQSEFNSLS